MRVSDVKRENGNIEITYFRSVPDPAAYEFGFRDQIEVIPVQPGDRALIINGKKICDIGAPESADELPEYVRTYHRMCYSWTDNRYDLTADTFTFYPGDGNAYIRWDRSGNVIGQSEDYSG